MKTLKNFFRDIAHYPSAVAGSLIILLLVILSIFAIVKIPYAEAIRLWRAGEDVVYQNPKFAAPVWYNWFSRQKQPVSFAVKSGEGEGLMTKTVTVGEQDTASIEFSYPFDYAYDGYPQDLLLYLNASYQSKQPFASVYLITPDERKIHISDFGVSSRQTFRFSQEEKLLKRLRSEDVMTGLFSIPESDPAAPLKGTYQLLVQVVTFEKDSDVDIEFVMHGQVFGIAGTDHQRRDLSVSLLWGAPVALAFGLLASLFTAVLTLVIAAIGAWYGGWLDNLIQRITEVNMVLPFYAILIMVGTFYSRKIWVILGVTVALSIFTTTIKSYRSMFMQVKESTYIEAAKAYGANNGRIIFKYLIPRIIPMLIPALVISVPSFVFLEASLAILGLGDPDLPTWGKMIMDAETNGALYKGMYYWILEPAILLMITGLGFAMLGFALDRIFNPKLRGQ